MPHGTRQPAARQTRQPRPIVIRSIGLDGVQLLTIPPELVGHPALTPFIPPDTPERFAGLKAAVQRLETARNWTRLHLT